MGGGKGSKVAHRRADARQSTPGSPQVATRTLPAVWSAAGLARTMILALLIAGSLAVVAPGGIVVAFAFAGLVVGAASADYAHAAVSTAVGTLATAVLAVVAYGPAIDTVMPFVAVGAAVGASAGGVWLSSRVHARILAAVGLVLIVVTFSAVALPIAGDMADGLSTEPADEGYAFDPVFFTKVFWTQERGVGFYEAYGSSFAADSRFDAATPDLAGWRSPVTSTLWSLAFSSASQVLYAFILLAAGSMFAAWFVGRKVADDVSALAAPALMVPYYLVAIAEFWFTEYEFWAMFAVLGSAALLVAKRPWPALGLATLAGAMREWLISGVVAGAVHLVGKRKWRDAIPWMIAAVAVVALYIANAYMVRRYLVGIGIEPQLGSAGRVGGGGPLFVLYTLQFCSRAYAHPDVLPYTAFFLGLAGAVGLILRKHYYLPALLLLPLAAFMVFGSGRVPGDP
ncbi:MAG: hypothetical protein JXP72_11195, partial [Coriobacteriia bacterium]|nr:hypothetical protein [Coriobacteriia bacterium]